MGLTITGYIMSVEALAIALISAFCGPSTR